MASEEIPERFTFRLYRMQRRAIKRMAQESGFSEAEIVRQAVDSHINRWLKGWPHNGDSVSNVEGSDSTR